MSENYMKKYRLPIFVFGLLVVVVFLFYIDWQNSHKKFTFAMLDVGQGDALFIESPTGTQILVDGGPPKKILNQLSRIMPPLDKSIDAIFITNPDQDHLGGFLDVLENYKVGKVFGSGTTSDSKVFQNFKLELKKKNIPEILVKKGMRINLGGGVFMDILFPDRDVSTWPTNDGSIVARLSYVDTSIMLTGDASIKTEKLVLENNKTENIKSEILKVGHHGSRNSTSEEFLRTVTPDFAFISDGKGNTYGHPHKEILDLFSQLRVKVFRTDLDGMVVLKSDGKDQKFSFLK
ncbi:MAG: MBL fold metallo-hydrolase [bacterium]